MSVLHPPDDVHNAEDDVDIVPPNENDDQDEVESPSDERHLGPQSKKRRKTKQVRVQSENGQNHSQDQQDLLQRKVKKKKKKKKKRDKQAEDSGNYVQDMSMQTDQERIEIRRHYRKLREETLKKKEILAQVNSAEFAEFIAEQERLNTAVNHASEAVLDAEQLNLMTQIGAEQSRRLNENLSNVSTDQFVRCLQEKFGDRSATDDCSTHTASDDDEENDAPTQRTVTCNVDWKGVGGDGSLILTNVGIVGFMNGALDIEVKRRQRSGPRINKVVGRETQPQSSEQTPDEVKTMTDQRVENLQQLLQTHRSVEFFKMIINPHSFTQSVENLFDLSFLIKDGHAGYATRDGKLFVEHRVALDDRSIAEGLSSIQSIAQIDHAMWKAAIQAFDIKEPLIPTRPNFY